METNKALKLKSYGNFGTPTFAVMLNFPQFITPMKNGKYLLFPQYIIPPDHEKKVLNIVVEEWQLDEDWNRSSINFPLNFTEEKEAFWIFKV